MSAVKVIPNSDAYRAGWERVFRKPRFRVLVDDDQHDSEWVTEQVDGDSSYLLCDSEIVTTG